MSESVQAEAARLLEGISKKPWQVVEAVNYIKVSEVKGGDICHISNHQSGQLGPLTGEFIAAAPRLVRDLLAALTAAQARSSRLEDAAFHFLTCWTCKQQGEDACESGRQFFAFMRGEADGDR